MIEGEGFVFETECKLFYILIHVADPKYIGIKVCWFGLVRFVILMQVDQMTLDLGAFGGTAL